ncbi:hypothetical protein AB1Y20_016791 [Prymnesium parvum]|uniref:BolA-like protein n=1 Tax=Prymnesium parvum TaxID=97485 RepID=A0AB34IDD8_PRYPA
MGVVEAAVRAKLTAAFAPEHLEVINESSNHCVPKGSETHFKVVVVSHQFAGLPPLERHRQVNAVLADELEGSAGPPVHALSIVAKTPEQWAKSNAVSPSPPCMGRTATVNR